MGTGDLRCCHPINRERGSILELNFDEKQPFLKRTMNSSKEAFESSTRIQTIKKDITFTDQICEQENRESVLETFSPIQDEKRNSNLNVLILPDIHSTIIKQRENRFVKDLEIEVKNRIKEIQEEECKQIQEYLQLQQKIKKEQLLEQQMQLFKQKQKETQKAIETQKIQKQQQQQQQYNQSSIKSETQSVNFKHQTIHSNTIFDKLLSEYYLKQPGQKHSTTKGILKKSFSCRHIDRSIRTSKSTSKSKRVHFSEDTKFREGSENLGQYGWKGWTLF